MSQEKLIRWNPTSVKGTHPPGAGRPSFEGFLCDRLRFRIVQLLRDPNTRLQEWGLIDVARSCVLKKELVLSDEEWGAAVLHFAQEAEHVLSPAEILAWAGGDSE